MSQPWLHCCQQEACSARLRQRRLIDQVMHPNGHNPKISGSEPWPNQIGGVMPSVATKETLGGLPLIRRDQLPCMEGHHTAGFQRPIAAASPCPRLPASADRMPTG